MAEIEGGDYLPEELPGLFRGQTAFFHQIVEQLSAGHVFKHQVPEGDSSRGSQGGRGYDREVIKCGASPRPAAEVPIEEPHR